MIYFDEDRTKTDNSQKKGEKCLEGIKKNNTFASLFKESIDDWIMV